MHNSAKPRQLGLSGYQELERLDSKLVSSIQELRKPAQELSWLLRHPHTPNTRKHPLLFYVVPRAMPSIPVLFRGCREESQPSSFVCEAHAHTRFIKHTQAPFQSQTVQRPTTTEYTTIHSSRFWRGTHHRGQIGYGNWLEQLRLINTNSRFVYGPNVEKMTHNT